MQARSLNTINTEDSRGPVKDRPETLNRKNSFYKAPTTILVYDSCPLGFAKMLLPVVPTTYSFKGLYPCGLSGAEDPRIGSGEQTPAEIVEKILDRILNKVRPKLGLPI